MIDPSLGDCRRAGALLSILLHHGAGLHSLSVWQPRGRGRWEAEKQGPVGSVATRGPGAWGAQTHEQVSSTDSGAITVGGVCFKTRAVPIYFYS